jgi:hypothetical protein
MTKELVRTFEDIANVLEDNGLAVAKGDQFLAVKVPHAGHEPKTALITIDEIRNKVILTCRVACYRDIAYDRIPAFQAAMLDANTRTDPFAFATIPDQDEPETDDPGNWSVVLLESLSLTDLSPEELIIAIEDLAHALPIADELLSAVA